MNKELDTELCDSCVFFPPNLPSEAYSTEDYTLLQTLNCSHEFTPGGTDCSSVRKTSCSILNLDE